MPRMPTRAERRARLEEQYRERLRRAERVIRSARARLTAFAQLAMADELLSISVHGRRRRLMSQRTVNRIRHMHMQFVEKERTIWEHLEIAGPLLETALRGEWIDLELLKRHIDSIRRKHHDLNFIHHQFVGLAVFLIERMDNRRNRRNRRILE